MLDALQATKKAKEYLQVAGMGTFYSLKSCVLEDKVWNVLFDVGIYTIKLRRIRIDAQSGDVLGMDEESRDSR